MRSRAGEAASAELAEEAAEQQRALHVDHRVPGPQGQPEEIKDWDDLARPGVSGHHAEPEDLGRRALELSRRLGLCARRKNNDDEAKARDFLRRHLQERAGARLRGARPTMTFVERGIGDVLIAWENEALLALRELGKGSSRSSCRR